MAFNFRIWANNDQPQKTQIKSMQTASLTGRRFHCWRRHRCKLHFNLAPGHVSTAPSGNWLKNVQKRLLDIELHTNCGLHRRRTCMQQCCTVSTDCKRPMLSFFASLFRTGRSLLGIHRMDDGSIEVIIKCTLLCNVYMHRIVQESAHSVRRSARRKNVCVL